MKRDCLRVEEALWEAARNGDVPPVHVRQHLDKCKECARAAAEARSITQMLQDADRVPEAPDCRHGVNSLIFTARKRQTWSYAWAGAALVVVLVAVLALLRPGTHAIWPVVAKKPAAPAKVASRPDAKKGTDTFSARTYVALEMPVTKKCQSPFSLARADRVEHLRTHPRTRRLPEAVATRPAVNPRPPAAEAIDPNRPVAVAVVTWDQQNEAERNSYEYSRTDAGGRVTKCKVVDTGDVIQISMVSTPASSNM